MYIFFFAILFEAEWTADVFQKCLTLDVEILHRPAALT